LFTKDPASLTEEEKRALKYRKLLNNHDDLKAEIVKSFEEYDKN